MVGEEEREEIRGFLIFPYNGTLETMERILLYWTKLNSVITVAWINFREERIFEDLEVIRFRSREITREEMMDKFTRDRNSPKDKRSLMELYKYAKISVRFKKKKVTKFTYRILVSYIHRLGTTDLTQPKRHLRRASPGTKT